MLALALLTGCLQPLTGDSPGEVFEHLWTDFDDHYALFEAKGLDWEAEGEAWRDAAWAAEDDDALHEVLTGLLGPLNDNHVGLFVPDGETPDWRSGSLNGQHQEDFALEVTRALLVEELPSPHRAVTVGWAAEGVGYLHVAQMSGAAARAAEEALAQLDAADALILDLRGNTGGDSPAARDLAGLFATEAAPFVKQRHRELDGPGYSDFEVWTVEPRATRARPTALLTNLWSISAAEWCTLALRTQPHVTQVGVTTAGAFASTVLRDLPNGWLVGLSFSDVRDAEGVSWEGVGLAPDVEVPSGQADLQAGEDPVLAEALALLAAGA
ncbi:MAG: hypothetical protein H6740_22805 [Alphaproteobacteria bacterium]|nr:hypothetical protein [Alphaproteobacteria bacterium]